MRFIAIVTLLAIIVCATLADCDEVEGKVSGIKFKINLEYFTDTYQEAFPEMNGLLRFRLCDPVKNDYCVSGTSVCFRDSDLRQYISYGTAKSQTLTFAKSFNGAEATFSQGSTCAPGKRASSYFRFECVSVFSNETIECSRSPCFLNCTVRTNHACRVPD